MDRLAERGSKELAGIRDGESKGSGKIVYKWAYLERFPEYHLLRELFCYHMLYSICSYVENECRGCISHSKAATFHQYIHRRNIAAIQLHRLCRGRG